MKSLVTYCLAGLLLLATTLPGWSAAPLTVVNFSVERGLAFSLRLDGVLIGPAAAPAVHLDNLTPGEHQAELSLAPAAGNRRGQRVRATVWLEEGLETSFVLTQRPGHGWQLRQVSTAALPGYGYEDQPGTYGQPAPPDPGYENGSSGPGYPGGPGYPPTTGPGYPGGPGYPPTTGPGYPGGPAYPTYLTSPAYPGPGGYPAPLSSPEAADLVRALKQYSFDDKRLPLFYQALSSSYVRAADLAQMVHAMTYSDSQKQAAKFGYSHLVDPQNFHLVLAALTFPTDASAVLDDLGLPRR